MYSRLVDGRQDYDGALAAEERAGYCYKTGG